MNPNASITADQIRRASAAGAELLASDEVRVPGSRMGDLIVLRELLTGIATGQLVVARAPEQAEDPAPPAAEPKKPAAKPRRAKAKK